MLYTIIIPAKLAAGYAAGAVGLMGTATLVSAETGAIVGAGALAPAAAASTGTSVAAAAGGASLLGPLVVGAIAVVGVVALVRWLCQPAKDEEGKPTELAFETRAEADAALAEVVRLHPGFKGEIRTQAG